MSARRVGGPNAVHGSDPRAADDRICESGMEDRKREGYF